MADFRVIPSIDQMRQRPRVTALERAFGVAATIEALRDAARDLRDAIGRPTGEALPRDADAAAAVVEAHAETRLAAQFRGSLRPVINATGVIVHTNLGRAPLAEAALARIAEVARGYCNLEYDVGEGRRGSRAVHAERFLTALTGAEAAAVVNNNAAATLLILAAVAGGREVILSRGELVEIGGGFRVPDVMRQSGAVLREVGTTNRTRVADYRAAIGDRTAMIFRVHPSNFRIEGFTERPALADLTRAAHDSGIPLVEDLGSGALAGTIAGEPSVASSIEAGVDLVCFSGDKLLGGPQCGIIAGRRTLVRTVQQHPLMRALRVDKLTLAALEATLIEYLAGRAPATVPVMRTVHVTRDAIETRARALAARLHAGGWTANVVDGVSAVGGGSAPGVELPTALVAMARPGLSADRLEQRMRSMEPPVIARIDRDQVVLDLRTVFPEQDRELGDALLLLARLL